jgi:predicted AlkP superfamily phosphohydrolase/phosphomutase
LAEGARDRRLVIVGIDGASHGLVKGWLDEGALPNMARLLERGSVSLLRSTVPPITFPAIPSFSTGKGPGGHGVSCFFRPKKDRSLGLVSSGDLQGEFWNLPGMAERRKVIVNLPLTYPAKPTNGVVVTGPLTPDKDYPGFVHPPGRAQELRDLMDGYVIDVEDRYLVGGEEDYVGTCERVMRARTDLFLALLGFEEWELAIVYYTILDRVQHHVFGRDGNRWVRRAYASVDGEVGRLVDSLDADVDILLFSDHGFGRTRGRFVPNAWLEANGYLRYKRGKGSSPVFRLMRRLRSNRVLSAGLRLLPKRFVRNSLERIADTSGSFDISSVDWEATSAHATLNGIHLNENVVEGGDELLERIEKGLRGLVDADGEPLDVKVWRREDVFKGAHIGKLPHLVYSIEGYAYEPVPTFERGEYLRTLRGEFKGWHREEGILLASGPDFAGGAGLDLSITDVAPTVLHLFGLPVPDDMDGVVAREIFRAGSDPFIEETNYTDGTVDEATRVKSTVKRLVEEKRV